MLVLIACELSGTVRDAFRRLGHDAWSCDLEPSDAGQNYHYQADALDAIAWRQWDLVIAHPPCTRLSNSGALRLYRGGKKVNGRDPQMWADMVAGAKFFRQIIENCRRRKIRLCVENPVIHGHAKALIGYTQTQTIQPHQFGHPHAKATCLWLFGLPKLIPTNVLEKPACGYWENQTPSGQNKLGPSPTRAKERSDTYDGIAEAFADQWGREVEGDLFTDDQKFLTAEGFLR